MRDLFMECGARLSDCGRYRYWLARTWDRTLLACRWVMLNPSTADATTDDPTVRRVMDFARRFGCGGIEVYNLFALRSPKPVALYAPDVDPVGPDNDTALRAIEAHAGPVVVAWGAHGGYRGRDAAVLRLLAEIGVRPLCLGVTKGGHPKHPLFVPAETPLAPFPEKGA